MQPMEENLNIAEVIKQHPDQWLLFEVLEADELDRPIQGRLLYHGKSRDELHEVAMEKPCPDNYIVFTGDPVPQDMVVIL
jgi:hypothetical protein